MPTKYYLVKILTNTAGQDASSVAVYEDSENKSAHDKALVAYHNICAAYHNADDVLYAVVEILNGYGDSTIKEIIDHRPAPEPEPEPEIEE